MHNDEDLREKREKREKTEIGEIGALGLNQNYLSALSALFAHSLADWPPLFSWPPHQHVDDLVWDRHKKRWVRRRS